MYENYSGSKCPKCQSTMFEMVEETPSQSNFKKMFVRCKSCKTVVGITDFYDTNSTLEKIAKALNINL